MAWGVGGDSHYLRSSSISAPLSRLFALLSNITAGSIWPGSSTSSAVVVRIVVGTLNIFHSLIIVPVTLIVFGYVGHLSLYVDLLSQ